jgi:hypothetical protein
VAWANVTATVTAIGAPTVTVNEATLLDSFTISLTFARSSFNHSLSSSGTLSVRCRIPGTDSFSKSALKECDRRQEVK